MRLLFLQSVLSVALGGDLLAANPNVKVETVQIADHISSLRFSNTGKNDVQVTIEKGAELTPDVSGQSFLSYQPVMDRSNERVSALASELAESTTGLRTLIVQGFLYPSPVVQQEPVPADCLETKPSCLQGLSEVCLRDMASDFESRHIGLKEVFWAPELKTGFVKFMARVPLDDLLSSARVLGTTSQKAVPDAFIWVDISAINSSFLEGLDRSFSAADSASEERKRMVFMNELDLSAVEMKTSERWQGLIKSLTCLQSVRQVDADSLAHLAQTYTYPPAVANAPTPNDPDFTTQWYLGFMDMRSAWTIQSAAGPKQPLVLIPDSGLQTDHQDLNLNLWVNLAEARGKVGVDDDNNGYIDDIFGIYPKGNSGSIADDDGHGTFVAGVVAAVTNNKIRVAGMHYNAKILGCRFIINGVGAYSDYVKCVNYGLAHNITIVSNSWGGGTSSTSLQNAILACRDKNVLVVTASGNSGINIDTTPQYPASYQFTNTITVGGMFQNLKPLNAGNYGVNSVQTLAPGDYIYNLGIGNGADYRGGTSCSTPIIAGLGALMESANPNLAPAAVKSAMQAAVRVNSTLYSQYQWKGPVIGYAALKKAKGLRLLTVDGDLIDFDGRQTAHEPFVLKEGEVLEVDITMAGRNFFKDGSNSQSANSSPLGVPFADISYSGILKVNVAELPNKEMRAFGSSSMHPVSLQVPVQFSRG